MIPLVQCQCAARTLSQWFVDNDDLTAMPLPLVAGFTSRKQKLSSHVYYDDQPEEINSTYQKKDLCSTAKDSMPDSLTGNDFWPGLNGQLMTSQEGRGFRVVPSRYNMQSLAKKGSAEIRDPCAQFSAGSWTEIGYPMGLGLSQLQSNGGNLIDRSASIEQQQVGTTQPNQVHYAQSPLSFHFVFFNSALSDGAIPYPMSAHLQKDARRQSEQLSALQQHAFLWHQQSTSQHRQQPGDLSTQPHESARQPQQQRQISTSSNNPVSSQNFNVNNNQLQQLRQLHQLQQLQQLQGLTDDRNIAP